MRATAQLRRPAEGELWNDGEQAEGEEETEADSFRCVCGRTFQSAMQREAHVHSAPAGEAHGEPADERERAAGACILVDTTSREIVAATQGRIAVGGDNAMASMRAEALTLSQGYSMCAQLCSDQDDQLEASTDCQSLLKALGTWRGGLSFKKRIRRAYAGPLQTLVTQEAKLGTTLRDTTWGRAEHNMNPLGDERLSDEACMNWACDALAKPCAFSGWENELGYHNYWGPTPTAEAPFSPSTAAPSIQRLAPTLVSDGACGFAGAGMLSVSAARQFV